MSGFVLILLSIFLMFLATRFLKRANPGVWARLLNSMSVLALLFISVFYFVSWYFTNDGINEAVFYHVKYGLDGAGFYEYKELIAASLIIVLIMIYAAIRTFKINDTKVKNNYKKSHIFGFLFIIASFAVNPASGDLLKLYRMSSGFDSSLSPLEEGGNYVSPALEEKSDPLNVIFIYLESLERTYLDENFFPGLTPGLKSLQKNAIDFTEIQQLSGTEWTIAGMTASQCGVPLVTPFRPNSKSGMDSFLSRATCVGDLLEERGYSLNYLGGASLEFAGKGQFFKSHGFSDVKGREELRSFVAGDYLSSWGLYDDSIFDIAFDQLQELSAKPEPFGLFLLTLDTHHPDGHPSASCENDIYGDGSNPILNAVHCTDMLVTEFVDKIKQKGYADDTLIVIASDHLAMRNTAYHMLEKMERKNLFFAIPPHEINPAQVDRPASTLDIGPTVLSLMGYDVSALGFGRDLMRESTLLEKSVDAEKWLAGQRGFLAGLWEWPQLDEEILVDSDKKQARMGERNLEIPALVFLDPSGEVEDIKFEFNSYEGLVESIAEIKPNQGIVWIDSCDKTSALFYDMENKNEDEYCFAAGRLGSKNWIKSVVNGADSFQKTDIRGALSHPIDENVYNERLARLSQFRRFAINRHGPLKEDLIIKSVGGTDHVSSYVKPAGGDEDSALYLARGLTLLGVRKDSTPVKLAHIDTCDPENPIKDAVGMEGTFADVIWESISDFSAYIIVAHDSAECGSGFDFAQLFEGLPLSRWNEIGFRTPYIGAISENGEAYERVGGPEESLVRRLSDFSNDGTNGSLLQRQIADLPRVAHAGGGFDGQTYTNSIEALDDNSDKYELFEIDFSWTSDGHLVCLHDWEHSYLRSFGLEPKGKTTLAEFNDLVKNHSKVNKCNLSTLTEWLKENKHARIVTDVKEDNIGALEKISQKYPELQNRFIPQVYQPYEYYRARSMGYDDVIWTLYRFGGSDNDVLVNLSSMDLYGLTMPRVRADRMLAKKAYEETGVESWVHTINKEEEFFKYRRLGVNSVYTDWLSGPIFSYFQLRSSGFGAGDSYVKDDLSDIRLEMMRGLTLFGFDAGKGVVKLAHIDSCGNEVKDVVGLDTSFKDVIDKNKNYAAFAIISHDSAFCDELDLNFLFDGLPLSQWREIGFRQPYIGVIRSNGEVRELIGEQGEKLSFTLEVN